MPIAKYTLVIIPNESIQLDNNKSMPDAILLSTFFIIINYKIWLLFDEFCRRYFAVFILNI